MYTNTLFFNSFDLSNDGHTKSLLKYKATTVEHAYIVFYAMLT